MVNQFEQDAAIKKVKEYKPYSLEEISMFTAAIRPSFQSMIDYFLKRKHFDYGIKAFDEVMQGNFQTSSFILFQESIMKAMEFAGIPSGETYTVIKAISKKKLDVIAKNKDIFIKGFMQHGECDEQTALKVWQIIEDASSYGFNSAHAVCVSYDSLYNAWLKYTYPYEFYKVCLALYSADMNNEYEDTKKDLDKVSALIKEMKVAFGIDLGELKWGNDNTSYVEDKENHQILPSLKTVKFMNGEVAQLLYDLYLSHKEVKDFPTIYKLLCDTKGINKRVIKILVEINYFKEFGKRKKLLKFIDLVENKFDKKTYNKTKLDIGTLNIIKNFARSGHEENKKTYRDIDFEGLYNFIFNNIPDEDLSLLEIYRSEYEYTGNILTDLDKNFVGIIKARSYKKPIILFKSLRNGSETWVDLRVPLNQVPNKESVVILNDVSTYQGRYGKGYVADIQLVCEGKK